MLTIRGRQIHEADKRTQKRLEPELGTSVRHGNQETGIWIVPKTGWWRLYAEESIYLKRGSRLKATWQFTGSMWQLARVDTEVILLPKGSQGFWYSFWCWLFPWVRVDEEEYD
jgi:hypothetical protein